METTPDFKKILAWRGVSILSARPVVAAAYDQDFARHIEAFAGFARVNRGASFLLQLGFEHETPEPSAKLAAAVSRFREMAPESRVIVLCNSGKEVSVLGALGLETRFIHQNCFLDERRYRPMGGRDRSFDAAYIARLTPFKRHSLIPAEIAPRLLLMGCMTDYSGCTAPEYVREQTERLAAARMISWFPGIKASELLSQAKCGLALSAAEGACFASSEYLLCGLPVVDTPALGGRAAIYPEEFVVSADAAAESVGAGIARWRERRPDPRAVRAAWLAKAAPFRAAYRELMRELTGKDPGRPPHKLGIRTPHVGAFWTLVAETYLLARGMTV